MKKIVLTNNIDGKVVEGHENERAGVVFEKSNYKASFSSANDELVSLKAGDSEVKLKYISTTGVDVGPKPIDEGQVVVYEDVENGVDLKYELKESKLKESFVVKKKSETYSFVFEADIGVLEPSYNEAKNSLELKDGGKVVYRMLPPFMMDADGEESKRCSYEVEGKQGGKLVIKLTADAEWINDEERSLPVIIDPTFEIAPILSVQCRVQQGGNSPALHPDEVFVGYKYINGEATFYWFTVEFDLGSLGDITSYGRAIFEMPVNYGMVDGNDEIVVYAGGKAFGVHKAGRLLGDGVLRLDLTDCFAECQGVTISVYSAYDNSLDDEDRRSKPLNVGFHAASLRVRDNDGTERAKLIIEPKEEGAACAKYDIGASGVTSVNLQTGRFKHTVKGLSVSSGPLVISADCIYDSRNSFDGPCGPGWGLSVLRRLEKTKTDGIYATYTDATGIRHTFFEKWFYMDGSRKVYIPRDDVALSENNEMVYKGTGDKVEYEVTNDEGYEFVSLASLTNYDARRHEYKYYISYKNFKKPVVSGSNYLQFVYYDGESIHYVSNSDVELKTRGFVATIGGEEKFVYLSKDSTPVNISGDKADATIYYGADKKIKVVALEKVAVYENADEGLYTTSELENLEYEKNQAVHNLSKINESIGRNKNEEISILRLMGTKILNRDDNDGTEGHDNSIDQEDQETRNLYMDFCRLETELISAYEQQLSAERSAYFLTRSFNAKIKEQRESVNDYIVEPSGRLVFFDGYGRLAGLSDDRENKIEIKYDEDSNVQEIKSKAERVVFKYDDNKKLSSMKKNNGETVRVSYYENDIYPGKLGAISEINSNGRKTRVTYDRGLVVYSDVNDEIVINNETKDTIKVKKYVEPGIIDGNKEFDPNADRTLVQNDKYEFSSDFSRTKVTDRIYDRVTTLDFDKGGNIVKTAGEDGVSYANYLTGKLISSARVKSGANIVFSKNDFSLRDGKYLLSNSAKKNYETRTNAYCLKVELGDLTAIEPLWNSLTISLSYVKLGNTYNFKQTFYDKTAGAIVLPFFLKGEVSDLSAEVKAVADPSVNIASFVQDLTIVEAYDCVLNEYDNRGRLWKTKKSAGKTTYLSFEGDLPTKAEFMDWDGKTVTTRYDYDDRGRLVYSVDSDGNCNTTIYKEDSGEIERMAYNLKDASLVKVARSKYDAETGNYIETGPIKNANGDYPEKKTVFYPGTNIHKTIVSFDGERTEYSIDPRTRNVIGSIRENGGIKNSVSYRYNRDFLTFVKSGCMEVSYSYDGRRRLKSARISGNSYDSVRNTYYDNVVVTDGRGNSFQHGSKAEAIIDGECTVTSEYDDKGRVVGVSQKSIDGSCSSHYSYGDDGELLASRASRTDAYSYEEEADYTYDDAGRLVSCVKVSSGDEWPSEKATMEMKYEGDHLSSKDFWINGSRATSVVYSYDSHNVLEKESIDGWSCRYHRDALKRVTTYSVETDQKFNLVREYEFLQQDGSTLDLLAEESVTALSSNGVSAERRGYSYDVAGRLIEARVDDKKVNYSYDGLSRLICERNELIGLEIGYSYDVLGNLVSKETRDLGSGALKGNDEFTYSLDKVHLLASVNGKAVSCDTRGRLTSYAGMSFDWGCDNTLRSVYMASVNNKVRYGYGADGLRRLKILPNGDLIRYTLDGAKILREERNGNATDYLYDSTGLLGFSANGARFLYERNALGDVVRIYDCGGSVVGEYAYDAYGNTVIITDVKGVASLNPFRYRGYYFDTETGLYYLNARYYDPRLGRFISPDSLSYLDPSSSAGMNRYAYCQCDPVNKVDPSGHFVLPRAIDVQKIVALFGPKAKPLFGWEYRTSAGWEVSEDLHSSFIGRIGISSYTTAVKGDGGVFYAFAGTTTDACNLLGTNYYAGVGFNFGDILGAEIQIETFGIGASVTLFGFTIGLDINLLGNISLTLGRTVDSGNDTTTTTGVTIGLNVGTLLWVAIVVMSLLTGNTIPEPSNVPQNVPQLA